MLIPLWDRVNTCKLSNKKYFYCFYSFRKRIKLLLRCQFVIIILCRYVCLGSSIRESAGPQEVPPQAGDFPVRPQEDAGNDPDVPRSHARQRRDQREEAEKARALLQGSLRAGKYECSLIS